jgi:hypothetical protein
MNTDFLVPALVIVAIVLALASSLGAFRSRNERAPETVHVEAAAGAGCPRHIWLVATREETSGHPRVIYRCQDCAAVEVRELA